MPQSKTIQRIADKFGLYTEGLENARIAVNRSLNQTGAIDRNLANAWWLCWENLQCVVPGFVDPIKFALIKRRAIAKTLVQLLTISCDHDFRKGPLRYTRRRSDNAIGS